MTRNRILKILFTIACLAILLIPIFNNSSFFPLSSNLNNLYAQESLDSTMDLVSNQPLLCSDGTAPDPSTGLCADGTPPQLPTVNATSAATSPPLVEQQQFFCADGSVSDPSTGLCADGTQPQSASLVTPAEQQQPLACSDGTAPDPSTGLCADGTQAQTMAGSPLNASVEFVQPSAEIQSTTQTPTDTQVGEATTLATGPTPTECDPNAIMISRAAGSTGPIVERLQKLLKERGFDPGPIDQIFGEKTDSAVRQFQKANNLDVDGIVGPNTWAALCQTSPLPQVGEICGDGIDNDADGAVDEGCLGLEIPVCSPDNVSNNSNVAITGEGDSSRCVVPSPIVDPPCPASTTTHPVNKYKKGIWEFDFFIKDGEGLVFENIKAGSKSVLDKLSVTHFKADLTPPLKSLAIRYCEVNDVIPQQEEPQLTPVSSGIDKITWAFKKTLTSVFPDVRASVTITYKVFVRHNPLLPNGKPMVCETVGQLTARTDVGQLQTKCGRLIPEVSYAWQPERSQDQINTFTAFYRLDYGTSAPGGRGLSVFGGATPGFIGPELTETKFNAVNGGTRGKFDNLHDMHKDQGIFVPGCRPSVFECFHMHWAWNPPAADILLNPEDDFPLDKFTIPTAVPGTPYLVGRQTIDIGIVKFKPEEQPPQVVNNVNPLSLVNGEVVAEQTEKTSTISPSPSAPMMTKGDHVVLYYVASSPNLVPSCRIECDTFFRHGIYVLDTTSQFGKASIPRVCQTIVVRCD